MLKALQSWIDARFPLTSTWKNHVSEYYAPKNLNFFYIFGALALLIFVNQLLTGLWLTMFYTPNAKLAFDSVEGIMRDVNYGWLFRYMHSTGASFFFIVIYMHMFRGMMYGSYQKPRELVWLIGMGLFLLLMAEAFFGYLLPWGQMSFWGAQVITSLFSAVPVIGNKLVIWIRGDYTVANATLQRFFALHVVGIPMLMAALVYFHIIALHKVGSNNPEGVEIDKHKDGIPFHPYYTVKDLMWGIGFFMLFFAVVFYAPVMGGYFLEADNFTKANSLVTPSHIAPVWYMTPFYAMLRAVPDKLLGVLVMGSAIAILFMLPWLDRSKVRSIRYKGRWSKLALSLFVMAFVTLACLGTMPVTPFRYMVAKIATFTYFSFFIFMPWYSSREKTLLPPEVVR